MKCKLFPCVYTERKAGDLILPAIGDQLFYSGFFRLKVCSSINSFTHQAWLRLVLQGKQVMDVAQSCGQPGSLVACPAEAQRRKRIYFQRKTLSPNLHFQDWHVTPNQSVIKDNGIFSQPLFYKRLETVYHLRKPEIITHLLPHFCM